MKKSILITALLFAGLLLSSCAFQFGKEIAAETAFGAEETPEATDAAAASPASEPEETPEQSAEPSPEKPAETGLTLEKIKQAAISAGYEVGNVDDYQMPESPVAVGAFNMIYEDEYSMAYAPFFEFQNAPDAQAYAEEVNKSGYNLCIINDKFLTITSASYGIPVNDNQTRVLEELLESTVMTYEMPGPVPLVPAADYSGACAQIDVITTAMEWLVNRAVIFHDKASPAEERLLDAYYLSFYMLSSSNISFTSDLSEDQAKIDAVKQYWEMFGVKDMNIAHDTPHNYIMTGQRMGLDTTFEIRCSFDPATGSLRLTDVDGGEVFEMYEFVPLGADKYAFQTMYERAIVEYKDGVVTSFVYSRKEQNREDAYSDADSIHKNPAAVSEVWVSAAGEDSYEQFITYDGAALKIAATSFMDGQVTAELQVK